MERITQRCELGSEICHHSGIAEKCATRLAEIASHMFNGTLPVSWDSGHDVIQIALSMVPTACPSLDSHYFAKHTVSC